MFIAELFAIAKAKVETFLESMGKIKSQFQKDYVSRNINNS